MGVTLTTPGNSATDTVLIRNTHTVTINTNFTIARLTVGEGTSDTLAYDGSARTTTVSGDISILACTTFRSPSSGSGVTHSLAVGAFVCIINCNPIIYYLTICYFFSSMKGYSHEEL